MKVPMSWFNDYTDISEITPKEYAHALTMTGSKVEGIENMGKDIEKVVTGKILTCVDHPDSDHLHVCTVDAGTGEALQIVCCKMGLEKFLQSMLVRGSLPGNCDKMSVLYVWRRQTYDM